VAGSRRSSALLERLTKLPLEQLEALPDTEWDGLSDDDRERLGQHILRHSTRERALVNDATRAKAALVNEFTDALVAYRAMLVSGATDNASEWVERLALRWREAGEERKLEQFGDDFLPEAGLDLLAALESSLVLAHVGDERDRSLTLDEPELLQRVLLVGSQGGVWSDWDQALEPAVAGLERTLGGPVDRGRRLTRPKAPVLPRRRRIARARELVASIDETMTETAVFYRALAPDGRKLSQRERAQALDRIRAGAVCARTIDTEHDVIPEDDHEFFRPGYALLRSMQRSLALAVSDDPVRRKKAMPLSEMQARAFMMDQQLAHGASPEEAWHALKTAAKP
jgi:hypothetical protein